MGVTIQRLLFTVVICSVITNPRKLSPSKRLAIRKCSPAYQRAMGHLALEYIREFLALQPPAAPTTRPSVTDFDLFGLGHKGHFALWLLPGVLLGMATLTLGLTVYKARASAVPNHSLPDPAQGRLL